ncbi:MAG: DUF523 and DUF1722 domain-containing protein [Gammaproteobacteria bacterium]
MNSSPESEPLPRVGVSSCLLGQQVRYDGGHKHNGYVTQTLGRYFELVPFCPEMAIGLGVPRPPIRLVAGPGDAVRALRVDDPAFEVTGPLAEYARRVADDNPDLSGYILKKGSPSCGMERVKVYTEAGMPARGGVGIYAQTLMAALPLLPVEEEGRLMDPVLRENFVERVFVYQRWQRLVAGGLTSARLVDFHTEHKFSILAHDEPGYREMGRLVAQAGQGDLDALAQRYVRLLMGALRQRATRKRHANVLMHIMGYLKPHLDGADKEELLALIDRYRLGQVPLIVPITLLRHFLRRFPDPYISRQHYLQPHPAELMLRNSL